MWRTGILLPLLVALLGVEQGKALSPCKLCQTVLTADVFAPCDAASKQARQDKRDAEDAIEDTGDLVVPEPGKRYCAGWKGEKKVACHNDKICLKVGLGACEGGKPDCTQTSCPEVVSDCKDGFKKKDKEDWVGCCFDAEKDCVAKTSCENKRGDLNERCGDLMNTTMCNSTLNRGDALGMTPNQTLEHELAVQKIVELTKDLAKGEDYKAFINKIAAGEFMIKHDVDQKIDKAIKFNLPMTPDDLADADRSQNPDCTKIPDDCKHGSSLHEMKCTCDGCAHPWTGEFCNTCPKTEADCLHNGTLNTELCECEYCDFPWNGELCDVCMRSPDQCRHGGVLDPEGSCRCEHCTWPWGGALCEDCLRKEDDCMNGGVWNPLLCMCEKCPDPWEGDLCEHCTLDQKDCEHGGQLNIKTCKCEQCDYIWTGRLCEVCPRTQADCMHGGRLMPDLCKCIWCDDPWKGDLCEICGRSQDQCIHGTLKSQSHESCRCEDGPKGELGADMNADLWEGPLLGKCRRLQRDCVHGGTMNPELCRCERCSHNYWGGDLCNTCLRKNSQCKHGSTLSQTSCKCGAHHWRHLSTCPYPWHGDFCGQCPGKCVHGKNGKASFDPEECICKECEHPWHGRWCERCSIHPLDCRHQSMLNMATCKCEGGDEPWTGILHDTCPLDQSDCQHNSKLNKETCDCEFCRYPWNGGVPTYAADDVMRVHWGPHQGKKVTYVGRSQTNGAKVVVKLNGKDIEIDVNYVKYDDANRLKNAMAGHLGGGSTCSVCNRKVGDCLHGSASVDLSTCKCVCPEPMVWDGEQCQTCTVDKRDCKFGSFFEKSLCKCKRCGKNFGGSSPGKCNQCAHKDDWCKNGGEMDPKTCTCKCKKGWNGDDCSEASCPVGANGKVCSGQGTCKNVNGWAYCHCHANHANADCSGSRSSGHCHTVGDPHPYNFDRLRFDWYNDGEVVLYKNTKNWEDDQMSAISTRYHSVAGNTGFAWRRRGRDGFHGHIKFMQPSRHSSCSSVHYCNNKNVCKRLSSNDCYSSQSWKELPNGLKFRYNGGGYEVQSLDGFQRVNWNSWWGPPKNRLNIYININEEKNSADGICGRHNPSNPLNPGHRWRNNIGLNSRNNGVWYRSYTPQQSQCKYPSLFDSGGTCPFSVNNGNFGNADASCSATGIPASEGAFEPAPLRFQQLGMKADGDSDDGNDAAAASKDESNPLSDLEKCPRAKLEAAPIEGGVCYTACKEEKNSEMQQGSQCWNCLNDWCTSGDVSVGAAAAGAVEDTKKAVADNVKEEDALVAVDNEQAAEDATDQERANAAAAMK